MFATLAWLLPPGSRVLASFRNALCATLKEATGSINTSTVDLAEIVKVLRAVGEICA